MSVWLVWAVVYAAFAVATLCLAGINRATATYPPCPCCGHPLDPVHGCEVTNGGQW